MAPIKGIGLTWLAFCLAFSLGEVQGVDAATQAESAAFEGTRHRHWGPAFVGMSKGGNNAYIWATANPAKVSCIYADNPAIRPEGFMKLGELAKNGVSLLNAIASNSARHFSSSSKRLSWRS
jgi:hypothetical protein